MHSGHRDRMKKKFSETGLSGFADHEILEMLLFYVIPRRNTNELAHLLLERFGSISGVLNAPIDLLQETKGVGQETALFLNFISEIVGIYMEDSLQEHHRIIDTISAKKYMQHKFIGQTVEAIYIACLASNGEVVFSDQLAEGSPETVSVRPVDVVKLALRANAVKVVLAHNHPHGIATPSSADLRTTQILYQQLNRVEIELLDHIIVASDGVLSMREQGMIETKETSYLLFD